jgi:peptidoglycan hydrolase CwlO-like protein
LADFIVDYFPAILALVAVVIAPLLIFFSRQNTNSITGTIKLETYSKNLEKLEEDQNKNFEGLSNKLDQIMRKQDNHEWRLSQIEKELIDIREKKIGVLEQELNELRNHKGRISFLENEIHELKTSYRYKNGGDRSSV